MHQKRNLLHKIFYIRENEKNEKKRKRFQAR
jgi:hypothetical protein